MRVVHLTPLLALAGGILILIFPRLLNYIVAIECITHGLRHPRLRFAGLAGLGFIR
jgi:hypothetical protein